MEQYIIAREKHYTMLAYYHNFLKEMYRKLLDDGVLANPDLLKRTKRH